MVIATKGTPGKGVTNALSSKASSSSSSSTSKTSVSSQSPKATTGGTTTSGSSGYKETTTRNADGSVTSTANRPQVGTTGTVKNADGSSTTYKNGSITTTDKSGKSTTSYDAGWGVGYGGTSGKSNGYTSSKDTEIERTKAVIANRTKAGMDNSAQYKYYKQLTGSDYTTDQSKSALGGDQAAIDELTGQVDPRYAQENELLGMITNPGEIAQLTEEQKQQMYQEYLQSAQAQLNPLINNYQDFLKVLERQNATDNTNMDMAYNQQANNMFSNQFAQNGLLNQSLIDRGMANSGIGQDALVRSQMAGNTDLMNAYISAQQNKGEFNRQYNGQKFEVGSKLAELSPEAMAARNMDAYKTSYMENATAAQAAKQKSLLEAYNILMGNDTSRMGNENDNNRALATNRLDNETSRVNKQLDSYTELTKTGMTNDTNLKMNQNDNYTDLVTNQNTEATNLKMNENTNKTSIFNNQTNDKTENRRIDAETYLKQIDQQLARDLMLTENTGTVYIGSKQLLVNGKPIQTVEYLKLSETQRHNIADENNISNKNRMDYELGLESNAILKEGNQLDYNLGMANVDVDLQRIAADLEVGLAKIDVDYAKLDLGYAKLESTNQHNQALISQAADGLQIKADANQLKYLASEQNKVVDIMIGYQKKKKLTKEDKAALEKWATKYNNLSDAMTKITNGAAGTGGGGASDPLAGIP